MSTTDLAKPSTRSGNVITSGGTAEIGISGSSFFIKVARIVWDTRVRVEDTTGDGDGQKSCFEHNGIPVTRFTLVGWAIESSAIGFQNLASDTNNPFDDMIVNLSSGRTLSLTKGVIENIRVDYDVTAPYIPLRLSGFGTATEPSAIEA